MNTAPATDSRARTLVLDNEAVQALLDPDHPKHQRALAVVEATLVRSRRTPLVVPTAVRVEAGWDRRTPHAAPVNRLRVRHQGLDGDATDSAAALRTALRVSVADAHLGVVCAALNGPHAVLTSDVADVRRLAAHLGTPTTAIRL